MDWITFLKGDFIGCQTLEYNTPVLPCHCNDKSRIN